MANPNQFYGYAPYQNTGNASQQQYHHQQHQQQGHYQQSYSQYGEPRVVIHQSQNHHQPQQHPSRESLQYHQHHHEEQQEQQQQQQEQQYMRPQMHIQNQPPYYPAQNIAQYDGSAAQYVSHQPTSNYQQFQQQQSYSHNQYQPYQSQSNAPASSYQQPPTAMPDNFQQEESIRVVPGQLEPESEPESEPDPEPEPPRAPSPEYELVLLSMVDEYLEATHSEAANLLTSDDRASLEIHDKLIATALACMDTILRRWRLQPLLEAKLRLKYARVLVEETENDYEPEVILTRGIHLAQENRLWDLQYTMQVQFVRLQHKQKPKAALKTINSIIDDVETYQHTSWIYVFRFLRMSLYSSTSNAELHASIENLHQIQTLARKYSDHSILVWAAAMEALLHLNGYSTESLDHAQRAMAVTRQMQLNQQFRSSPQIQTLVQLIDVCCSLQEGNHAQTQKKLQAMHQMMDTVVDDPAWLGDGSISLPITKKSTAGLACLSNEIIREESGSYSINMSWMPKRHIYCIGYLISAASMSHKNASDGQKAEKFLREGLKSLRQSPDKQDLTNKSIGQLESVTKSRRQLECYFYLQLCFLLCARGKLDRAQTCLDEIRKLLDQFGEDLPIEARCQYKYLKGAISQADGDLENALTAYQDPDLTIPLTSFKAPHSRIHLDICLLATMNTVLIIRNPTHPQHSILQSKLSYLATAAPNSYSKNIQAAHQIILSTLQNITHLQLKDHLSRSLNLAKEVSNHQITSITLSMMSWKWFRGVMGEQAEKGARAMQNTAKLSGNPLWVSVADGMLSETLERMGKIGEAEMAGREGLEMFGRLPERVKASVE